MNLTNENEGQEKKLERWLDAALSHYIDDEPRRGLEGRVLATLEAERRQREQHRRPWRLVVAAGVAMVLAAAVIVLVPWRSTQPPVDKTSASNATVEESGAQVRSQAQPPLVAAMTPNPPSGQHAGPRISHTSIKAGVVTPPRLPQFPSPEPLSAQERLLVAFVNSTPPEQLAEDAALQQRLRSEVVEAREPGGGAPAPRGK